MVADFTSYAMVVALPTTTDGCYQTPSLLVIYAHTLLVGLDLANF